MTTNPHAYFPLNELADRGQLPLGEMLDDVMEHVWLANPEFDEAANEGVLGVFLDQEIAVTLPGIPAVQVALGSAAGGVDFEIRARLTAPIFIGLEIPLTLRVDGEILRPLKPGTNDPDPARKHLDISLGTVKVGFDGDGNFTLDVPAGISVPRCMIGSTGVILEIGALRWITPATDLAGSPEIAAHAPPGFTGLYLENASLEVTSLPIEAGRLTLEYGFIGTGGFSGAINWSTPSLLWNGNDFEQGLHGELFGFKGALSKVKLGFRQNALTECEVSGNLFVPYLDRVIGLAIGLDGSGGVTAVASVPTCAFTQASDGATAGPSGYLITADTDSFRLDISRIAIRAGGDAAASLAISGRAKLKIASFELPAVVFQGLSIDTEGHVAVEGGWLDVESAKSSAMSGFPFQITKIGFGAETARRRWIGLNGGLKLADGLPIGASVEGLRVIWDLDTGVSFSLDGVGLELKVKGVFSFAGKVAFFSNAEATGFRGTLKLSLDSLKLTIDAALMVGRTSDGTSFFFFYLDIGLPVGIPLFSTGAAIYGFAGLLAVNLKPARAEGENWYYGYYRRPAPGVTDPAKWAIQRDAFAIGLGTTIGSLPDTGFSISAKILLVLVLPGPQLLLQGKGQFISQKPDEKDPSAEGTFEALLVLDIPARLFQANLAIAFKIGTLIEVAGGIDAAFSWSPSPPVDIWHVYLGEKTPEERRIHAKLFKILQGDTWLMINRPHTWPPGIPNRAGDFEIGGSLGVNFKFDFSIVKAWLEASMIGEAAVTFDPQQFTAMAQIKGSAGVSALGLTVRADIFAEAMVRAPNPWLLTMNVEVGIKVDLILTKWEFHSKLPLKFGDESQPLPEPVTGLVTLHADHGKVDEARALAGAIVAPDARPLLTFRRPVQDLARFGAPGRDDLPAEDLATRQFSYRLRHLVLLETSGGAPQMVGAAGQVSVSGNAVTFAGLTATADGLPNLAGAELTLFRPGEPEHGPLVITAGGGSTATVSGGPPAGEYSYRLTAPRPSATAQITAVDTPVGGEAALTVSGPIPDPSGFRGGNLTMGNTSWLVLDAAADSVRVRTGAVLPETGTATLMAPAPAHIEGQWMPAGDPVDGPDSSTRLQLWAKTPYAFFRHNEQEAIAGLDAFDPAYACGPVPTEEPVCTSFEDVPVGLLSGDFFTAGLRANASGLAAVAPAGSGDERHLQLAVPGGHGAVSFLFEPPVDAVWVTVLQREAGKVTAWRESTIIDQRLISRGVKKIGFSGGIDRLDIEGTAVSIYSLCFLPGWTCVTFDAKSFPKPRSGTISYAGVTLSSQGKMLVRNGTLEVNAPTLLSKVGRAAPTRAGVLKIGATGKPAELLVPGLVETTALDLPALGRVVLVPSFSAPVAGAGRADARAGFSLQAQVWAGKKRISLASLSIVFPRPVTRVRVRLGRAASVIAYAGTQVVERVSGAAGQVSSIYANPQGPSHLGWIDRLLIIGRAPVEVSMVCTDRGDFGWKRYEQWKWSQGVRRSVEALYSSDPVLAPGNYELRAHMATVITGVNPGEVTETERATFTVGDPPGFPAPAAESALPGVFPSGGPLTDLSTYVDRTLPPAGTRVWYRELDTAVGFNESYVTRLYLESGRELRVSVVNASGVAVRANVRHVWAAGEQTLDAWTALFIRTLNGDGADPCATVSVDRVVRPEGVTASGKALEPARLHASELRTTGASARVVHRFEFTTSRYVSFRHHVAMFDGRCRRLVPDVGRTASVTSPADRAAARATTLVSLATAITNARNARDLASAGTPSIATLDAAKSALDALSTARANVRSEGATGFDEIWQASFGAQPPAVLPDNLKLSIVEAATAAAGTDVILLESPEPIAWDRVAISAVRAGAAPRRRVETSFTPEFGRPDQGFEITYGGIRWLAGAELWVVDGVLRARADVPLDVTLFPDQATRVELTLNIVAGASATIVTTPAQPGGAVTAPGATTPVAVVLTAPADGPITSIQVTGDNVGLVTVAVTGRFVPIPPAGPLRIAAVKLPTATQPLDHEITLLATERLEAGGYTVRWIDATMPAASEVYASVAAVELEPGQRLRLAPGRASAPATDDSLVQAGGPGSTPPASGSIYQLVDPDGRVVQEIAAMPVGNAGANSLVAFPNADETRAILVAPAGSPPLSAGHWKLTLTLAGDCGPDLEKWSVNAAAIVEPAELRFELY